MPLEFWFDFASTYSYPTAFRIEQVCRDAQVELRWRPFLLGPIFNAQGWNDSPFNIYPAKGRYMWRDLERVCLALGAPLRKPSAFPRNGLLAARIACWYEDEPWIPAFAREVFAANFADDRDIADAVTVASVLEKLGLPSSLMSKVESPEAKLKLRAQTDRAKTNELFGAPSFLVGEELFWGNDRLEAAVAWARRASVDATR